MENTQSIGRCVWYKEGERRDRAMIIAKKDTIAKIRLTTGTEHGREIEVPWTVIEPVTYFNSSPSDPI